ncbi:MAG: extracellular solute-binding protein [Aeromonadales bacterium]|nr:extracellular solute-binding protein [Aeromonadales bacterium]
MRKQLSTLAIAFSVTCSVSSAFAEDLIVWEDEGKSRAIESATKDFERECNCKVTVKEVNSVNQISDVAKLAENGERIPDVFILLNDRLGEAVDKDLITPVNFMVNDEHKYMQKVVKAFKKDGSIYASPRSVESLVIYYNKDLIEYPSETLKQYEELGDKMKAVGKYGLIGKIDQFYFAYGFLAAYGAYVFGTDKNGNFNPDDVGLNNKGAVAGVEELSNYISAYLPKDVPFTDEGWGKADKYFKEGKAAAIINGPWALGDYASSGVNYGLAPLPKLSNGKTIHPFFGAKGYVISKASKNKDLAERYVKFINKAKYAQIRYMASAELPPLNEVLENPLITNDDFANAIANQVEDSDIMPYIPKMASVWTPMTDALYAIMHDHKDAKETLDRAIDIINGKE